MVENTRRVIAARSQFRTASAQPWLVPGSEFCGGTPPAGKPFVKGGPIRLFLAIFPVFWSSFNVTSVVAVVPHLSQRRRCMIRPHFHPRSFVFVAMVAT